ncbi:PIN domain-like protein [Mycena filopes]|nr:PIN domain-like protein [Mycena filopes]
MGSPKLWNILAPASEPRSLLNLATFEGFETNNRGHRAFVVGIDASIRIRAVIGALQVAGVFHPGVGGQTLALEKLFYQLCNFSSAPVTLVFVFDGPGRPPAPGEAEAELALLNADGRIDAIITEDSDAFLFGARVVIRTLGPSPQDISFIYSIDAIENTDTVLLDRAGLILCALLLGGDYGSGVPGIGEHIAHGLAAGGFGTDLVNILKTSESAERAEHLAGWRKRASGSKSSMKDLAALKLYRVRVSTQNFITIAGLGHLPATPPGAIKLVSIPGVILAAAMGDMSLNVTALVHIPFNSGATSGDSDSEMLVDSEGSDEPETDEEDAYTSAIIVDVLDSDEEDFVDAHRALSLEGVIDLTE